MDFGTNQLLITGANGWLGKTLVNSLIHGIKKSNDLEKPQKKLKIKCLVLPNENNFERITINHNVFIQKGDITNINDCLSFTNKSKDSILIHCAGIIHPRRTKEFYSINVKGMKNILDASVKEKIRKVIVVSSNSPCGTNPNKEHLFEENHDYNPYMEYGQSKMMMEKLVNTYHKEGKIETVIIRPPWFYGPFQPNRQNRFYQMIKDGTVPVVGNGENRRSMACTINIAQGIIRASINDAANGNIYWIADKRPYSFNEIIETIRLVFKNEFNVTCKEKQINLPSATSTIAYYIDSLIQRFGYYNKEIHVLSEMNKTIACSIKKAEKELCYSPTVDLYEGTTESIRYMLSDL